MLVFWEMVTADVSPGFDVFQLKRVVSTTQDQPSLGPGHIFGWFWKSTPFEVFTLLFPAVIGAVTIRAMPSLWHGFLRVALNKQNGQTRCLGFNKSVGIFCAGFELSKLVLQSFQGKL